MFHLRWNIVSSLDSAFNLVVKPAHVIHDYRVLQTEKIVIRMNFIATKYMYMPIKCRKKSSPVGTSFLVLTKIKRANGTDLILRSQDQVIKILFFVIS